MSHEMEILVWWTELWPEHQVSDPVSSMLGQVLWTLTQHPVLSLCSCLSAVGLPALPVPQVYSRIKIKTEE